MKQKTTAQIREELRKDMTKMFEKKYQYITNDLERYKKLYHQELEKRTHKNFEYNELKEENAQLKEKIASYEDWIHRLQEFMDIKDDEERKIAFESYIKERQTSAELADLMNVYNGMLGRIFGSLY